MEQNVGLDPRRQFAHRDEDLRVALACPHPAKGGGERFLLLRSGELGDQQSVADGDLIFQERLSHRRDEVGKPNSAVNVRLAFRGPGCNGGNAVGGFSEFKQCPETQSFLKRVDVLTLEIFNALGFDRLRICEFDDADGKVFKFRDAGGPQTTRSGYDFVFAFLQFAHQQGRENALRLETRGLLCRSPFCARRHQTEYQTWRCPLLRTHNV